MVELLAAGCREFPKLNIFQKAIKDTCERKNHQSDEMQILALSENSSAAARGMGWEVRGCVYLPSSSLPLGEGGMLN